MVGNAGKTLLVSDEGSAGNESSANGSNFYNQSEEKVSLEEYQARIFESFVLTEGKSDRLWVLCTHLLVR